MEILDLLHSTISPKPYPHYIMLNHPVSLRGLAAYCASQKQFPFEHINNNWQPFKTNLRSSTHTGAMQLLFDRTLVGVMALTPRGKKKSLVEKTHQLSVCKQTSHNYSCTNIRIITKQCNLYNASSRMTGCITSEDCCSQSQKSSAFDLSMVQHICKCVSKQMMLHIGWVSWQDTTIVHSLHYQP